MLENVERQRFVGWTPSQHIEESCHLLAKFEEDHRKMAGGFYTITPWTISLAGVHAQIADVKLRAVSR
jgi:hypothetical protein